MRFLFVLARLWGCPVSEVMERLDTDELPYWIALYELDPWGEYRADVRHAVAASAVCGSMGARVRPAELIPDWDQGGDRMELPAHDQQAGLAAWMQYIDRHNGGTRKGESG